MSSSDEKDNYLSPVQASQKRRLEKDLTSAMSKLLDIKLKNLPTKSDVEGLKQELKSDIGDISLQVKQLTDDNARLKEEVISLRSDREADKRTINMLLEQQKKKM